MEILTLDHIKKRINLPRIIEMQEEGFKYYSAGKVEVPPVGYLKQANPEGSYHIKYGLIENDKFWVTKIAGGPNAMPLRGMMVVISTKTGTPQAILCDDGYLTQLRTAVAGLITAKYMAPKSIRAIGVLGSGEQARLQVEILKTHTPCRTVYVWARNIEKAQSYKEYMEGHGFSVVLASTPGEVGKKCNLIVTTTPSQHPLLQEEDVQPGTHITAVGADEPGKTELDPKIFLKASLIAVDSKSQCIDHGEVSKAYRDKLIEEKDLIELGEIVTNPSLGRTNDHQITVCDLTGIAVQDIQIAKAVLTGS